MAGINVNILRGMVTEESLRQGLNPRIALATVFGGEMSSGDPMAKSPAGARGIMQLMPDTAKQYGVTDVNDPRENIRGGVALLKDLHTVFGNNPELIFAGYHAGAGAVQRAGNQVPNTKEPTTGFTTRSYVDRAMQHYRGELSSIAPNGVSNDPYATTHEVIRESVAARDPRQPIVDMGLQLMGKTRKDFGNMFANPDFLDHFYQLTVNEAMNANPALNITSKPGEVAAQLSKMVAEKAKSVATPGVPPEPTGKTVFPHSISEVVDIPKQTLRGLVIDPVTGIMKATEDLAGMFGTSVGDIMTTLHIPGGEYLAGKNATGKPVSLADTIEQAADKVLGHPETYTSDLTRSLAGFIMPFKAVSGVAKGVGAGVKVASAVGGAGALVAFTDPDGGSTVDLIDKLARGMNPQDPDSIRSAISRYIYGEIPEDTLRKRIVGRTMRGLDAVLFEGVIGTVRMLRGMRQTKTVAQAEPLVKTPDVQVTPKQMEGAAANDLPGTPIPGGEPPPAGMPGNAPIAPPPEMPKPTGQGYDWRKQGRALADATAEKPLTKDAVALPAETPASPVAAQEEAAKILKPEWVQQYQEHIVAQADTAGLTDDIVRLAQEGKTAAQIATALQSQTPEGLSAVEFRQMIRAVRGAKGIASLEEVRAGEGTLADTLTKVKETLVDPENQKIVLGAMLRGSLGYLAADEVLSPSRVEAGDNTVWSEGDRELAKILIAVGAATGGGYTLVKALQRAKALRAAANPELAQSLRETSFAPPRRFPGSSFIREKPEGSPATVGDAVLPNGKRVNLDFFAVRDAEDLAGLRRNLEQMYPDMPPEQLTIGRIPITDIKGMSRELGLNPRNMQRVLDNAKSPEQYSKQAKTIIDMASAHQTVIKDLATRIRAGEDHLTDEFIRQVALGGEIYRGLELGSSDFGRALNVFRQAADGLIEFNVLYGPQAGVTEKTAYTATQLAMRFLALKDSEITRVVGQMTELSPGRALAELLMNARLARPAGAVKQVVENTARMLMEVTQRGIGAAEGQMWGLSGYDVPKGTPVMSEPIVMLHSMIQNAIGGLKAAWHTARTGEYLNLEFGTERVATLQPQFVKEAFGVGPGVFGNIIDAIGAGARVAGGRLRIAADEMAQYIGGNMELDAQATRAASYEPGLNTPEKLAAFLNDFKANPPPEVLSEIAHKKAAMTYMSNLFDERGGFQAFKEWVGNINHSSFDVPLARTQFPFLKAYANLFTYGLELTPGVNLISKTFREGLRSTEPTIRADAWGKLGAGLGLAMAGAMLGARGVVTGPLSVNPALTEELKRAGRHPASIHFDVPFHGHVVWKLDPTNPIEFLILASGALGAHAGGEVTPAEMDLAQSVVEISAEMLLHMPVVNALGELVHALDQKDLNARTKRQGAGEAIGEGLDRILLREILPPTVWQNLVAIVQPHKKVYDDYLEKLKNRTIGSGETETDIMERPRFVGGGVDGSRVNNMVRFIFPADILPVKREPLDEAMVKKGVVIRDPRASIGIGPIDVPLTGTQVQELKRYINRAGGGPTLYQTLNGLVRTAEWTTLTPGPDGTAHLKVEQVVRDYVTAGRAQFLGAHPEIVQTIRDKAKSNGFTVEGL